MVTLKPLFGYLAYHRISLKELAEKSGISYPTLLAMRREDRFTIKALNKLCLTLNLNIKDVIRYEG